MNLNALISIFAGRKKRRSLSAEVDEHSALQAKAEKAIRKLFKAATIRKISADEFKHKVQRKLVKAYEESYKAGKGSEILSSKDRRWINSFAAKQFDYLEGFADDIDAGNTNAHEARAALYGKTVQAAYWKGALSEFDEPVDWVIDDDAENCDDCLELAENGPYEPDDLPTTPGAGDTRCLSNCKCRLISFKEAD